MQNTIIIINGLVLVLLIISFFKNRTKTLNALKIAGKSLLKLAPTILSVILLIGIIYGLFSDKIALLFGQENGVIGFTTIAVFGSVMHMPSLLAFPLAGSFLLEGVSISSIAAFITTLTMIVIFLSAWACIKIPQELVEMQFLGIKFMFARLGMTIVFITIMGIIINKLIGSESLKQNR